MIRPSPPMYVGAVARLEGAHVDVGMCMLGLGVKINYIEFVV